MKRTNLVLDEKLLKEAVKVLDARTYSEAVNKALAEAVRAEKMRGISKWFGSGIWEGDLDEMRADRTKRYRSRGTR